MTQTELRTRPEALRVLRACLVVGSLGLLSACDAPTPRFTTPAQLSLLEHFAVAERRGPSHFIPEAGSGAGGEIVQGCNSEIAYHFVMPEAGQVLGRGRLERASADGAPTHTAKLAIDVTDADGGSRTIFTQHIDGTTPELSIDRSLDAAWQSMMRVGISLACEADEGQRIRWSDLQITGTQPAPPAESEVVRDRYNVLIILLDSLRADQIQPYGSTTVETPRLQQLADGGVTFRAARSTAAWTRPAVASLLTSMYSLNHSVLSLGSKLPADLPYLPSLLRNSGYETILITNSVVISGAYGFNRGFNRVYNHYKLDVESQKRRFTDPEEQGNAIWGKYIAPAAAAADEKPFFVYLHERDPHSPYVPPAQYGRKYVADYVDDSRTGTLGLGRLRNHPEEASPERIERLRGLYRGEVSYMDRYVGALLDRLEAAELDRSTLVVFVSDHGEEFWEHESVGHGHTVYDELLRVPLILRLPGVLPEGLATDVPIDLADILPSILDLLAIEPPASVQGASIFPYLLPAENGAGRDAPSTRAHFSAAQANARDGAREPSTTSVVYRDWKLIHVAKEDAPPLRRLFDLGADAGEQTDIATSRPIVVGTLDQIRRSMRRTYDARRPQPDDSVDPNTLDPEVDENLRALGYID